MKLDEAKHYFYANNKNWVEENRKMKTRDPLEINNKITRSLAQMSITKRL